jgi:hypothetical protein
MKTSLFLSLICLVIWNVTSSQSINNKANPAVQLRQLLQLSEVGVPLLKMPEKLSYPQLGSLPRFNIAAQMTEAKGLCPFLKYTPTLQLEGNRNNNTQVGLHWETTNGSDNELFYVERSLSDTLHFERVNLVWATEKSGKNKYSLPDNNSYDELTYYRLRLLLNDGKFLYSNTATVQGYDDLLFTLSPNPVANKLTISLSSKVAGMAGIEVYDALGKTVYQQPAFINKGNSLQKVDVTRFTSGVFTLKVLMPDKHVRVGRFLKI